MKIHHNLMLCHLFFSTRSVTAAPSVFQICPAFHVELYLFKLHGCGIIVFWVKLKNIAKFLFQKTHKNSIKRLLIEMKVQIFFFACRVIWNPRYTVGVCAVRAAIAATTLRRMSTSSRRHDCTVTRRSSTNSLPYPGNTNAFRYTVTLQIST
jgi:hypothetical protein